MKPIAPGEPIELDLVDGTYRLIREQPAKPKGDASGLVGAIVSIVLAIIVRLVFFGPIHH